jgi:hypothetical protein
MTDSINPDNDRAFWENLGRENDEYIKQALEGRERSLHSSGATYETNGTDVTINQPKLVSGGNAVAVVPQGWEPVAYLRHGGDRALPEEATHVRFANGVVTDLVTARRDGMLQSGGGDLPPVHRPTSQPQPIKQEQQEPAQPSPMATPEERTMPVEVQQWDQQVRAMAERETTAAMSELVSRGEVSRGTMEGLGRKIGGTSADAEQVLGNLHEAYFKEAVTATSKQLNGVDPRIVETAFQWASDTGLGIAKDAATQHYLTGRADYRKVIEAYLKADPHGLGKRR